MLPKQITWEVINACRWGSFLLICFCLWQLADVLLARSCALSSCDIRTSAILITLIITYSKYGVRLAVFTLLLLSMRITAIVAMLLIMGSKLTIFYLVFFGSLSQGCPFF